MMSHINEMLYRTSKVTGESLEEVLQRFMNAESAMYSGLLGAGVGAALAGSYLDNGETR